VNIRQLEISTSKLSVITGLRRREIDRLLKEPADLSFRWNSHLTTYRSVVSDKRFQNSSVSQNL